MDDKNVHAKITEQKQNTPSGLGDYLIVWHRYAPPIRADVTSFHQLPQEHAFRGFGFRISVQWDIVIGAFLESDEMPLVLAEFLEKDKGVDVKESNKNTCCLYGWLGMEQVTQLDNTGAGKFSIMSTVTPSKPRQKTCK